MLGEEEGRGFRKEKSWVLSPLTPVLSAAALVMTWDRAYIRKLILLLFWHAVHILLTAQVIEE